MEPYLRKAICSNEYRNLEGNAQSFLASHRQKETEQEPQLAIFHFIHTLASVITAQFGLFVRCWMVACLRLASSSTEQLLLKQCGHQPMYVPCCYKIVPHKVPGHAGINYNIMQIRHGVDIVTNRAKLMSPKSFRRFEHMDLLPEVLSGHVSRVCNLTVLSRTDPVGTCFKPVLKLSSTRKDDKGYSMLFNFAMQKNSSMAMTQEIRGRNDCMPSSFMKHLGTPQVDFFFGKGLPSMLQPILSEAGYKLDENFVKAVAELVLIDTVIVNVDRKMANFFLDSDYIPFALDQGHALREYRSTTDMLVNSAVMKCVRIIWGVSAGETIFGSVLRYLKSELPDIRRQVGTCLRSSLAADPLIRWLHAGAMPSNNHSNIWNLLPLTQAKFFSQVFNGETRRFTTCEDLSGCRPNLHIMLGDFVVERLKNLSASVDAASKTV